MWIRIAASLSLAVALTAQPQNPRAERKTIQVEGVERSYMLATPMQRSPAIPIVFVFHGAGGSGERVARLARMHNAPFARQALVVYPDGVDQQWTRADVPFIRALIDDLLKSDKALDRTRVFAVGVTQGGSFALRLGCEAGDRIAAVASVGGPMFKDLSTACAPPDPMPVLLFSANNAPKLANALSPQEAFADWNKRNACAADPLVEERAGSTPANVSTAKKCKDGAEVRWVNAKSAPAGPWQDETSKEIAEFISRFHRAPRF